MPLSTSPSGNSATEALQSSEIRYRRLFETAQDGILLLNAETAQIEDVNPYLISMLNYSHEEFLGKKLWEVGSFADITQSKAIFKELQTNGYVRYKDLPLKTREGREIAVEFVSNTYECDGKRVIQCNIRDITERKQAADKIEHQAFYDALTGLPNRRLLRDRLRHSIAASERHQNYGAVLFIDLDHFKDINDTRGHAIGDMLLVKVAERLQACVREGDTVARLGGDEFIVILEKLSEDRALAAAQTSAISDKILAVLGRPHSLAADEIACSASIGISLFRSKKVTVDELLQRADTAMYQAKSGGRNTRRFYDPALQARLEARTALETDLRCAQAKGQLSLHYQKQVDHQGRVLGAEALVRWQHPEHGLIPPVQFIPLAEESGLILTIGQWVLETACARLEAWEAEPLTRDLKLGVNVSARQFHHPDFVGQVRQTLRDHAFDTERLRMELTESAVMNNIGDSAARMHDLKRAGVRFSLDDFGTGHTSLTCLTQLPLDQIKIDRSFVRNIGREHTDSVMVQTIIGMARNLGIEVIAAGVEKEEQRAFLEQHGCPLCQGHLFGEPVPVEEFEATLRAA